VSWFAWFQARVKPGVVQRAVAADLDAISAQLAREFHQTDRFNRTEVFPISNDGWTPFEDGSNDIGKRQRGGES
jgi:hypothetical protein